MIDAIIFGIGKIIAALRDLVINKLSPYGDIALFAAAFGIGYYFIRWKGVLTATGYIIMAVILYLMIKFARGV